MPNLKKLELFGNRIGDSGLAMLADAFAKGALANLEDLFLGNAHEIGDTGMSALAKACASGALARLTSLEISWTQIGDSG